MNILGEVTVGNGALFYLGNEKPFTPPFATSQGSVTAQEPSAAVIQNTAIGGLVSVLGGGAVNAIVEALSHTTYRSPTTRTSRTIRSTGASPRSTTAASGAV